jgi:DNA-binding response OmpR family regulator/predicted regulator of Ras-like GTPase activity (Roadblock/LC7/MglB family)
LILDDDQEFLDTYGRILARLPSRPEVRVANCATRAFALLETEPFALLITDLRMPKIDGFQVLMGARRRFPTLKTVAITGLGDQQYRARAYASGIDLYTEKPTTPTEIRLFAECVDALLTQGSTEEGFRGVQSKSLMDLIQIECLSQNSRTLRITRGSLEGRVWIDEGNVIDAELQDLHGEEAFRQIFGWKTGNFEILPGDAKRQRTIFTPYESLLLDSAQQLDESRAPEAPGEAETQGMSRVLQPLARVRGVESLLLTSVPGESETWGVENPEKIAAWTHKVLSDFTKLGESLNSGPLRAVEAVGSMNGVVLLQQNGKELMAGLDRKLNARLIRAAGKELATYLEKE